MIEKTKFKILGTVYAKVEERPRNSSSQYKDTFLLIHQDTGGRGTTLQINATVDQIRDIEIGDDVTIEAELNGFTYEKAGQENCFTKVELVEITAEEPTVFNEKPKPDNQFGNAGTVVEEGDIPF